MKKNNEWYHEYEPAPEYSKRVAYFSMEFAIHQALKIYSGGLGFLAGSHMRSGFELKQNMVGIGMLWKYGYYDQERHANRTMEVRFQKKFYNFLQETGIKVPVYIDRSLVYVKALYLPSHVFNTVPMYFLTTDIPENDYLARTITHRLYDPDPSARIAQNIILGVGGAKVVDAIGGADIYHMNEGHALPLAFHLYSKYHSLHEVQSKVVFTTHTPEKAGNEEHHIAMLEKMGFFSYLPIEQVRQITGVKGDMFSHTLVALRMAKIANGVSKLHGEVSREMWLGNEGICEISHITNAQNQKYWQDFSIAKAIKEGNDEALVRRKKQLKEYLFDDVANQTGKLFDKDVLTIVWSRRFAEYKRADLMFRDMDRFAALIKSKDRPVQFIWAGKPYPLDTGAINIFNNIMGTIEKVPNCAVLTGYELHLSKMLKRGADVWLNTPRIFREASGTSGMTASMNAAINFSIADGWVPEFAEHGKNSFVIPPIDGKTLPIHEQDRLDCKNMYDILENEIIPMYYEQPDKWLAMMKENVKNITPFFGSNRMADEYYKLYSK
ncbi:MAG: alpha-glucan family phosphorylase [Bacteroidetes bacterium]|nr:MAG: alpha-glucan family phosphorylase [Bacteroidota bacterium]